ncbi:MAG: hypothetical protein NTX42_08165 [Methanothrix sp.]|nr:hypothetical protein [Methanothrix sp.]
MANVVRDPRQTVSIRSPRPALARLDLGSLKYVREMRPGLEAGDGLLGGWGLADYQKLFR